VKNGFFNGKHNRSSINNDETELELSDEIINSRLQVFAWGPDGKKVLFPDCDFLLKFDSSLAMAPYLPWNIRLTEILQLGRIDKFGCGDFLKALSIYGHIEQRFGV